MIEIRYSAKREKISDETDISGSQEDFELLRQTVLIFLEGDAEKIAVEVNKNADPERWDLILEGLEIDQRGGAVKISVSENKILKIKGSKNNLNIFAAWLEFDEDTISGYHAHYEYYEGNEFIDSGSIPLVIRLR